MMTVSKYPLDKKNLRLEQVNSEYYQGDGPRFHLYSRQKETESF